MEYLLPQTLLIRIGNELLIFKKSFNQRIIASQHCVGFCHTTTCISYFCHTTTCISYKYTHTSLLSPAPTPSSHLSRSSQSTKLSTLSYTATSNSLTITQRSCLLNKQKIYDPTSSLSLLFCFPTSWTIHGILRVSSIC